MTFYLKYRPQKISDLDLSKVQSRLKTILSTDSPPHAYLFTGPRGLGKTSAARIVAKTINCLDKKDPLTPCNVCPTCTSITKGTNLDVLEIDAASNRGIDEIRSLKEKIKLVPSKEAKKVYIIDEVHMLTTEAFNALLKTLEEPPPHAFFVLATTEPQKVPQTIVSRCFKVDFDPASISEIVNSLKKIVKKEKIEIDDDILALIAQNADQSFREAVKLLEEASFSGKKITSDSIKAILGQNINLDTVSFINDLVNNNLRNALSSIEKLSSSPSQSKYFIQNLITTLHQHLLSQYGVGEASSLNINPDKTILLISLLEVAFLKTKTTTISTLPLEIATIKFCSRQNNTSSPPDQSDDKKPTIKKATASVKDLPSNPLKDQNLQKDNQKKDIARKPPSDQSKEKKQSSYTLDKILDIWPKILESLKPFNHSLTAVLRSARPLKIDGNTLTIQAYYKFHQERISEPKTIELIEKIISELLDENLLVSCCLGEKEASPRPIESFQPQTRPSQSDNDLVEYIDEIFN